MSEYIITKRTECDMCHGKPMHRFGTPLTCFECMGAGYTEQCVADADEWLLSRLAKLQFALVTVTGDYENERQSLWDLEFKD